MANQIPLSGLSDAAGGVLLPTEQGDILANGILQQSGALALAGDSRATTSRRTQFPIWMGRPTAEFVGEAGTKPVTGAEFGAGTLNVKKIASIVIFTDEQLEDVQNGDLNVLVDGGVQEAIADVTDAHAVGKDSGTNLSTSFDIAMRSTTSTVEFDGADEEGLRLAVSAAMGTLEANGYNNPANMGVLLAADASRHLRDARAVPGGTVAGNTPLYQPNSDPLYGLDRQFSTNLNTLAEAGGSNKIVGFVVYKPNLHVRIRKDIEVSVSREASVKVAGEDAPRSLWQENLTGLRYETRLGYWIHDINRAVVAITNGS